MVISIWEAEQNCRFESCLVCIISSKPAWVICNTLFLKILKLGSLKRSTKLENISGLVNNNLSQKQNGHIATDFIKIKRSKYHKQLHASTYFR